MTLVDTSVLLDLVTDDANWAASLQSPLLINDMIYAELGVRYERIETLDSFIAEAGLERVALPRAALFLAGKVFAKYRRAGGARTGVLPDFFIGAHAAIVGIPLLTRDASRTALPFPLSGSSLRPREIDPVHLTFRSVHSGREFRHIAFEISRSLHRARQSCVFRMAAAASRDWWRFGW